MEYRIKTVTAEIAIHRTNAGISPVEINKNTTIPAINKRATKNILKRRIFR
jgi:hypothetical protein